jgi:WD40 repeat protein
MHDLLSSCQLHQVIESAAVLDLKWYICFLFISSKYSINFIFKFNFMPLCRSYQLHSDRHWLGQANADGELRVYTLPPSNSQCVAHRLDLQFNSSKLADGTLALSLDWNDRLNRWYCHSDFVLCAIPDYYLFISYFFPLSSTVRAAASFSDGSIRIFDFGEASDSISPLVCFIFRFTKFFIFIFYFIFIIIDWRLVQSMIKAHELEAWIVAFDHFQPNVIYSGADDCTFKGWDLRQANRIPSVTNNRYYLILGCTRHICFHFVSQSQSWCMLNSFASSL